MATENPRPKAARKPERGPICPGDHEASVWTFTADRWEPASYLWRKGDAVTLSFVAARQHGQGYLRDLIAGIERAGFRVRVPTPLSRMEAILRHYGFRPHDEWWEDVRAPVEIWERP